MHTLVKEIVKNFQWNIFSGTHFKLSNSLRVDFSRCTLCIIFTLKFIQPSSDQLLSDCLFRSQRVRVNGLSVPTFKRSGLINFEHAELEAQQAFEARIKRAINEIALILTISSTLFLLRC